MTGSIVGGLTALALGVLLVRHRARYLAERPFEHDHREYVGARALAEALGSATGLTAEQGPAGSAWLLDFLLWPVLLLWGDLRLSRAETQLARWRLVGKRGDRDATIALGPDRVTLSLSASTPRFSATSAQPLDQQESMRALHPIGSDAWRRVTPAIEALFALGADQIVSEPGTVYATWPRESVTLGRVRQELDALERLATS